MESKGRVVPPSISLPFLFFLFCFPFSSLSASEESYDKMNAFVEENALEITKNLCTAITRNEYSYDPPRGIGSSVEMFKMLYRGAIGNFHPAKMHYLEKNEVPLLHWQSHLGSYFVHALLTSQDFHKGVAACFQKLANDPEKMHEKIDWFINEQIFGADILAGITVDVVATVAGLKIFKVVGKAGLLSRGGARLGKLLPKRPPTSSVTKGLKKMQSLKTFAHSKKAKVLGVLALTPALAYTGDRVLKANFDFDIAKFLKLRGEMEKEGKEFPAFFSPQKYEDLLKWVDIWQSNQKEIIALIDGQIEGKDPVEDAKSLSYHAALREIILVRIFSKRREGLEYLLKMCQGVIGFENEALFLSSILGSLDRLEEKKREKEEEEECLKAANPDIISGLNKMYSEVKRFLLHL